MADGRIEQLVERGLYELLRLRLVRVIPLPNTTGGNDWSTTVPGGVFWELLAAFATLNTSAVVANRIPTLNLRDTDNLQLFREPPASLATAGQNVPYAWGAGVGYAAGNITSVQGLPAPPALLTSGGKVQVTTQALDAGDTWTGITVTVREWSPQQVVAHAAWISRQLPTTYRTDEGGA